MDYLKQHQQQSIGFDLSSVDLLLSDLTITDQSSPVSQIQSSNHNNRAADPSDTPNQNTQNPNSAYLTSMPTTQVESPRHQFHHQQPRYIPPPQYIHHQAPPIAVPVTSFYHHHHAPPNQHNFMYYISTTQPPQCYNYPLQQPQPSQADTRSVAPTKTDLPVYRTNSGGPQLVRIPSV
ncbi:uncharacterized protein LOC143571206 [Bidens hawaiensis]|uniref:uncharacterized protein LOC143571206 n=1 Tax=Bidens hawaiensis TaxID=980011 RepID=UPI00404B80EB